MVVAYGIHAEDETKKEYVWEVKKKFRKEYGTPVKGDIVLAAQKNGLVPILVTRVTSINGRKADFLPHKKLISMISYGIEKRNKTNERFCSCCIFLELDHTLDQKKYYKCTHKKSNEYGNVFDIKDKVCCDKIQYRQK